MSDSSVPDSTPQGTNCPTFNPPPLDGSYTVPELFDYNAKRNPEHPLFVFADGERKTRTICFAEAWRMIRRTARNIQGHYKDQEINKSLGHGRVIGILAVGDTISYFCTIVGIMRLGLVPFPISIRNSAVAVAHLVKESNITQLLVSPDPAMQHLASDAIAILRRDEIYLETLPMTQFVDIADESHLNPEVELNFEKLNLDGVACLLHSSGSTSFPKIITVTNRTVLQWAALPCYGQVDLCGMIMGVHVVPLFHVMGIDNIFRAVATGMVLGVYKPSSPPAIPTPESYLEEALAINSSIIYCVPSFVEAWFREPSNIPAIKSFRAISFGGAPLNKGIGDQLANMGVALFPFYGSSETGCISMFMPSDVPSTDEWEYFKISPRLVVEMLPQEGMTDVFEIAIIHTPHSKPNVINSSTGDGRGAYRTNDLLQRHPQNPLLWKVFGRADEQLMLSNGEKTNPVPLEAILVRDTHVASAIMFGRGRFQNGVLIEPKKEFAFDPRDEVKLAEFRNIIWPSVEKLNQFAPAHSRLFKEMIIVSSPSKPFEYTLKGTPRRPIVIKAYEQEINDLYNSIVDSSQTDLPTPLKWTENETLDFIRLVVRNVVKSKPDDNVDIFQEGCDSLQATYIRNSVVHALRRSTTISVSGIANNFVYSNPTIASMSAFVSRMLNPKGEQSLPRPQFQTKTQEMKQLLRKYTNAFPVHIPALGENDQAQVSDAVLLTGSTGRVGCHLLAQLISNGSVTKVYALNRKGRSDVKRRQREAFRMWGLDVELADFAKVMFLEGDLSKADLGLGEQIYEEIKQTVTSIIHNAWHVDFNLALSSFEPLISSVHKMVSLSLGSSHLTPPHILFVSSIAVFTNHTSAAAEEVPIDDPIVSVGTGYGESKWVAESILLHAMKERGVRINIVRVGQLCGDSLVGRWNQKEWVASMFRGSQVIGAVPQRDEVGVSFGCATKETHVTAQAISWLHTDVAASAVLDMLGSDRPVLHLVHPKPVDWSLISNTASALLKVPSIPYLEWLSKLERAHKDSMPDPDALEKNPALKLIDFFLGMKNSVVLRTDQAVEVSSRLKAAKALKGDDVEKWVAYWQSLGFLAA
ncbi:tridomain enzyme adenylation-thiolation-dehydrogenase [Heterobasidion irregulare TC 32-1]|uniref:Tridomain enzyme adenylation-thiolation-dehydrogenase n=1 Tax=Heterobasidion irregulare (strain TC 32-1) TaxID=747525 RepID=W4JSS4_HETIT|nr:tridomain enzyme adenylation-thiolation-dehydrogenase [Heterobasidion irregulare TC 32-1]ETW76160.1 tridomain enzyme adenylation-thiolation-dehydrogenase [Heterobasidion irregulare TC 32-1]